MVCILVHNTHMFTAAVLGSAGYTGQETLDRLLAHPSLEAVALGSDSLAGRPASALDPRLNGNLPRFVTNAEAAASGADVLFLCLDHDEAATFEPPPGAVVVDLSAAHRLADPAVASAWYGDGAGEAWSYGLPELWPPAGRLVANPGCYATAALLALAPLAGVIDGRGRRRQVGRLRRRPRAQARRRTRARCSRTSRRTRSAAHRHAPEMAQQLGFPVCFVAHLLPVRRGLLVTCYVQSDAELRPLLEAAYWGSDVVRVLPEGTAPELARVQGTDAAELGVFEDAATGTAIVICAIDNLGKGAAGQAVQNANLALGLPETEGLRLQGVLV